MAENRFAVKRPVRRTFEPDTEGASAAALEEEAKLAPQKKSEASVKEKNDVSGVPTDSAGADMDIGDDEIPARVMALFNKNKAKPTRESYVYYHRDDFHQKIVKIAEIRRKQTGNRHITIGTVLDDILEDYFSR